MRQLTVEEIRSCVVAGGIVTSGHITGGGGAVVTAWTQSGGSPTIPGDFSGAGGGAGPVKVSDQMPAPGPRTSPVTNKELTNAINALMKEISLQSFGADVLGPNLSAIQAGNIAIQTSNVTLATAEADFSAWVNSDGNGTNDVSAQGSWIPWQELNWSAIDPHPDSSGMTFNQAMANLANMIQDGQNPFTVR